MKGIVFTELLSMAEAAFSPELVEEVIIACDLPSGGAYTAIADDISAAYYNPAGLAQIDTPTTKPVHTPNHAPLYER